MHAPAARIFGLPAATTGRRSSSRRRSAGVVAVVRNVVPAQNAVEPAQVDGENETVHACLRGNGQSGNTSTLPAACMDSFGRRRRLIEAALDYLVLSRYAADPGLRKAWRSFARACSHRLTGLPP